MNLSPKVNDPKSNDFDPNARFMASDGWEYENMADRVLGRKADSLSNAMRMSPPYRDDRLDACTHLDMYQLGVDPGSARGDHTAIWTHQL